MAKKDYVRLKNGLKLDYRRLKIRLKLDCERLKIGLQLDYERLKIGLKLKMLKNRRILVTCLRHVCLAFGLPIKHSKGMSLQQTVLQQPL